MKRYFLYLIFLAACSPNPDVAELITTHHVENEDAPECIPIDLVSVNEVMQELVGTCAGCHKTGPTGFFASLDAFANGLIGDPRFVVPGDPGKSELISLLAGTGEGSSGKMPPVGPSFSETNPEAFERIVAFVTSLNATQIAGVADIEQPTVRPLTARHFERAVRDLLGLEKSDFFNQRSNHNVIYDTAKGASDFPVHAVDAIPGPASTLDSQRFLELGGGSAQRGLFGTKNVGGGYAQVVGPLSISWCEKAILKDGTPLLSELNAEIEAATDDQIRENIARLYSRFIGKEAKTDDVDHFFEEVYVPIRDGENAERGWVAVCASLIQDPQFLLF